MKKSIFHILTLLLITSEALAQSSRHVIFLSDKNNSPYSISNPAAFLSPAAITRRINQNISITTQDLPVNPAYLASIAGTGATILNRSKWFNSVTVEVNNPSILNTIQSLPFVLGSTSVGKSSSINDTPSRKMEVEVKRGQFNQQNAHRTTAFNYGSSSNQVTMLRGDVMHNLGYTGQRIVIAVLDAGFSNANNIAPLDSLFANGRILSTWDFVDNEQDVFDDDAHGSMVLSVIGGNSPGELIGTAPHASFHLLRSENAPAEAIIEEYNWASAAEYADSVGAHVINSSLGYTVFDNPAQNHTYANLDGNTTPITIAADIAASKGMVVCSSAGNEGNGNWFRISAPADADSILAVGAVDASGLNVGFSGKGPSADGRVKPDVSAQGFGTIVADPWNGTGVFGGSGTSFSSPLIAGMVATLWQCSPNATSQAIIGAIRQSGTISSNPDSLLGYGIPDFVVACMMLSGLNPELADNNGSLIIDGNPFQDALTISYFTSSSEMGVIELHDISGRLVWSDKKSFAPLSSNKTTIQTTGLAKGVYVISISAESGKKTSIAVKN
ncbi:MAG: S8/S53 family peptidase [Bacteroidota bacterium]